MQIRITGRPTGPLDPADIHHITRPQLDELSLSGRLAVILDGATDRLAADVLGDAIMPEQVTSDLLDEIDAVEAAAKRLAKKIAKLDESRQTRHTLRAERAERDRLAAEAADAERQAEAAAAQALAERVARMTAFAAAEGMSAEPYRDHDGIDKYRLLTDNPGHRLLPHRFDNPADYRRLDGIVRGKTKWTILPESTGSLEHVESWLAHHCRYAIEP